jgi:putative RecB family exonuclease
MEKRDRFYSHSKISSFEQCKLKYKFRYIDKIIPEFEKTIEAHFGTCIHDSLEWLYQEIKKKNVPSADDLILKFIETWQGSYSPEIKIIKEGVSEKDYFNKGINVLVKYYFNNHPFKDEVLDTEKKIIINLEEGIKIIGYIDRLNYNEGSYEIHDYKTTGTMPSREKLESDRQLALYSIAVKELFGKDKEVRLIWHFLEFGEKVILKKSDEELDQLKQSTLNTIKEIELTKEFPPNPSKLCDWCEYKNICPVWNVENKENPKPEVKERYPTLSKYFKN